MNTSRLDPNLTADHLSRSSGTAPTASPLTPPTLPDLPGYDIQALIGQGGMGAVYRAQHLELRRLVAIKTLTGANLDRFQKEAAAIAALQHSHVIQLFDINLHATPPFFAMEYVSGGNLAEHLATATGPRDYHRTAHLIRQLACALHYVHCQSIVHRDLKPANILLTADGQPKISDFGLAKHDILSLDQTTAHAILGTPSYMAPEQAQGHAYQAGPATDIYALGAILYELLTGQPPFKAAAAMDTMYQIIHDEPIPPQRLEPATPRDLATICLKCLAKEPSRRYPTAAALADDLECYLSGQPIKARPVTGLERVAKWIRRHPLPSGLAASLLLLIILSSLITTVLWQQAEMAHDNEVIARQTTERSLYFYQIALADRELSAIRVAAAEHLLAQCPAALRHWEWHYLKRHCHTELTTYSGHDGPVRSIAWSSDGQLIASASSGHRSLILRDAVTDIIKWQLPASATGEISRLLFNHRNTALIVATNQGTITQRHCQTAGVTQTILSPTQPITAMSLTADDRLLAVAAGHQLHLFDLNRPSLLWSKTNSSGSTLTVAFHPTQPLVATGDVNGFIKLWQNTDGQLTQTIASQHGLVRTLAWNPRGTTLASGGDDSFVRLWSLPTGHPQQTFAGHTGPVWKLAFLSDNTHLISSSTDSSLRLWHIPTAKLLRTLRGHSASVNDLALHPAGHQLVSGSHDTALKRWDVFYSRHPLVLPVNTVPTSLAFTADSQYLLSKETDHQFRCWIVATGQPCPAPPGPTARPALPRLAVSPDSRLQATAAPDHTIRLFDTAQSQELSCLRGHTKDITALAFSADGQRLASGSHDRSIRIWDVATGREVLTIQDHQQAITALAFSPDGRHLASASRDRTIRLH